jgi:hypothetical protein
MRSNIVFVDRDLHHLGPKIVTFEIKSMSKQPTCNTIKESKSRFYILLFLKVSYFDPKNLSIVPIALYLFSDFFPFKYTQNKINSTCYFFHNTIHVSYDPFSTTTIGSNSVVKGCHSNNMKQKNLSLYVDSFLTVTVQI